MPQHPQLDGHICFSPSYLWLFRLVPIEMPNHLGRSPLRRQYPDGSSSGIQRSSDLGFQWLWFTLESPPTRRLLSARMSIPHANKWDPQNPQLGLNLSHIPINGPPSFSESLPLGASLLWLHKLLRVAYFNHTLFDGSNNPCSSHPTETMIFRVKAYYLSGF